MLPCRFYASTVAALVALALPVVGRAETIQLVEGESMQPAALPLREAISIALERQPRAAIAQAQQTVAKEQVTQAKAKFLPTVTPQATLRDERQTLGGDSVLVSPGGRSVTAQGARTSVVLSQTLLDAGQRGAAKDQAMSNLASATAALDDTQQAIVLDVTLAFYEVLRNRDLIKVSQSGVDRAATVLALTQGQIDAGTLPRKDSFQARADLANAQLALRQSQDRARTALIQLRTAMGVAPGTSIDPAPISAGDGMPTIPTDTKFPPLETYFNIAQGSRPDLRQRAADTDAAKAAAQAAKIGSGVQVGATYQYAYTPTSAFHDTGVDSLLLVSATYPLFDGGAARSAVRSANAQVTGARAQTDATLLAIASDVEQSYIQREQAIEEARLAQVAVDAAQVNYDAITEARREGIGNVVDIAQAQLTLTQAQSQYVSAVYNYFEAHARLHRAAGINVGAPPVGM
ncbi:MAG TPA: TolC family protein [Capsulimonadaceae bacterium]|jgi:outer membrane protein